MNSTSFLLVGSLAFGAPAEARSDLDAIAASYYPGAEPGAAVLVVKDGEVLLRKGYGLADLEHEIEISPEMVTPWLLPSAGARRSRRARALPPP